MKQAADYRKLALKRAKDLGMPLPEVSPKTKAGRDLKRDVRFWPKADMS